MSCISPLIAYPNGYTESGKVKYMPSKRNKADIEFILEHWDLYDPKPVIIPCGKCIGCRLDYSREWAARCMLELKEHDSAYFVTLTYNESEVPLTYFPDPETGEALSCQTLRKRDFQLWMKNLRKAFPNDRIRFYACGEYGSKSLRPHYHAIIFGLHLDDLKFYKKTDQGTLWISDSLSRTWFRFSDGLHFDRGFVVVGDVTWDTCAYVARYTAKKYLTLGDELFDKFNMEKPFVQMSRRPGIGRGFLERNPDLFNQTSLFLPSGDNVKEVSIPRYFYKCLESTDPDLCNSLRERNKRLGNVYTRSLIRAHKRSYDDLLADAEANLLAKSRSLQREI